jgi:hypothetical protein
MSKRTIRGTIKGDQQTLYNVGLAQAEPIRIILDNGDITRNFRILSFKVYPNMRFLSGNVGFWNTGVGNNLSGVLTLGLTEESVKYWGEFENVAQIGWACFHSQSDPTVVNAHLDEYNIVVQDLYIGFYASDFGSGGHQILSCDVNYEIVIESVKTDAAVGVLNMVREKQNR